MASLEPQPQAKSKRRSGYNRTLQLAVGPWGRQGPQKLYKLRDVQTLCNFVSRPMSPVSSRGGLTEIMMI